MMIIILCSVIKGHWLCWFSKKEGMIMSSAWRASRRRITWAIALLWSFSGGSLAMSLLCFRPARPRTLFIHFGWMLIWFAWSFGPGKAAAWITLSLSRIGWLEHCSAVFLVLLSRHLFFCLLLLSKESQSHPQRFLLMKQQVLPMTKIHYHFLLAACSFYCCFATLSSPSESFYTCCSITKTHSTSPLNCHSSWLSLHDWLLCVDWGHKIV